jgi:hypothetical protein
MDEEGKELPDGEVGEKGAEKIYLESSDMAVELYRSLGFEDMNGYMKLNTIK